MRPYVIRQGDFLAKLAVRFGFDAGTVWNDPSNRALRDLRPNHDILAPGDVLHIPAEAAPGAMLVKGAANVFTARVPTVRVEVALKAAGAGDADNPFCNCAYELHGLAETRRGAADADGRVRLELPVDTSEVFLVFRSISALVPVRVGHLDPIDTASGVRQRLDHLGHDGVETGAAIRAVQRTARLPETGILDAATRDALVAAHAGS